MARMIQALKNLEARTRGSARALGPIVHLAENNRLQPSQQAEWPTTQSTIQSPEPSPTSLPAAVPVPAPAEVVNTSDESAFALASPGVVMETAAAPSAPAFDPILVTETAAFSFASPVHADGVPSLAAGATRNLRHSPVVGQPSSLERAVLRALGDPVRATPLYELADRLRRDLASSKTVLLVGLGPHSSVQRPLLCTAALLADQAERVLLIDADLARRDLTEGLQAGQEPGFAEVLRGTEAPNQRCRPTAFAGISLLPAGLLRHFDVSTAGSRLEAVLRQLSADFSLLLLDGGCGRDLGAVTLARLCDVTYFVVQLGAVEANQAQSALRDFRAAGARVLGCIAT